MSERAIRCPQCSAPLAPGRFARTVTCPFCSASVQLEAGDVKAAVFREAWRAWNSPAHHGFEGAVQVGGSAWAIETLLARGDSADVYAARRARWPTERAIFKVLRDPRDRPRLASEWRVLQELLSGAEPGQAALAARLPQPIVQGDTDGGAFGGRPASVFRWASGFVHTFEDVRRAHPGGIEARAAVWVWRRILELLAFLHGRGYVHAALLPSHLLVEQGEHGVRLVGYGCADREEAPLRAVVERWEPFYPASLLARRRLRRVHDVAMSARCVLALLGARPDGDDVQAATPAPLRELLARTAAGDPAGERDAGAWALREILGRLGRELFGPPAFCPLTMPR